MGFRQGFLLDLVLKTMTSLRELGSHVELFLPRVYDDKRQLDGRVGGWHTLGLLALLIPLDQIFEGDLLKNRERTFIFRKTYFFLENFLELINKFERIF